MEFHKSDYKEYPKTLAPDDFWGQVRRTVFGKPVPEEQILMIVEAIKKGLQLEPSDILLDIACGNGALSSFLFQSCREFVGVDYSDYLIEVAKKNFEKKSKYEFKHCEAVEYVQTEPDPQRFTKVLCYGSFPLFSADNAYTFLQVLSQRFTNVRRLYIGNLPDKDRAHLFYQSGYDYSDELDNPVSQIGIWRSPVEFEKLAISTGWKVLQFHQMPKEFFAAHYRYDVILERTEI
jgi:cyclopropane fatty-acyl-phospholipid synthase-like methyltransferase